MHFGGTSVRKNVIKREHAFDVLFTIFDLKETVERYQHILAKCFLSDNFEHFTRNERHP